MGKNMRALLTFLIIALCTPDAWAQRLKLGYSDVENFPYQMGNGQAPATPPGLAVELIREAARDIGLEVQFVRMPAVRLLVATQTGEIDGSFIFSYKEERLAQAVYPMKDGKPDRSRRITTINYSFYKKAGSPVHWDGKTLSHNSEPVGVNSSFSISDDLKKMGIVVDDSGKSTAQNLGKLRLGRISAYATLEDSADAFLARQTGNDVVKLTPPITSRDYYLVVSRKFHDSGDHAQRLWTRIAELRDKRTPALLQNYSD
jgi:polar amino acid transport system substrate-binding protein